MGHMDEAWLRREYLEKGRSPGDIAGECGLAKTSLYYWLDKHDIPRYEDINVHLNHVGGGYYDGKWYPLYECFQHHDCGQVLHHRLAAVAWFGFDAVVGNHVHHKNGISWDTREDNVEVLSPREHQLRHFTSGADLQAGKSP